MSELSSAASASEPITGGPGPTQTTRIEGIREDEIMDESSSFIVEDDDGRRVKTDPPASRPLQRNDGSDAISTPPPPHPLTFVTENKAVTNQIPTAQVVHLLNEDQDDERGLHYKRTTDGDSRITNNNEILNTNNTNTPNNRTSDGTLTPPQSSTLTATSPNNAIDNRNNEDITPQPSTNAVAAGQQQQKYQPQPVEEKEEIPDQEEQQVETERLPDIEQKQKHMSQQQQKIKMSNKSKTNQDSDNTTNNNVQKSNETTTTDDWFQSNKKAILIVVAIVVLIVIIIGSVCLGESGNCSNSSSNDDEDKKEATGGKEDRVPNVSSPTSIKPSDAVTTYAYSKTLNEIQKRGKLLCGVTDMNFLSGINININPEGFNEDLCRAVTAGIFGSVTETNIEYIQILSTTRFIALQNGTVDLLAGSVTHIMERDVYETTAGTGFAFSIPYLYGGLSFGGVPPYGTCADSLSSTTTTTTEAPIIGTNETEAPVVIPCSGMKVCVEDGTTYADIVPTILPDDVTIVPAPNHAVVYMNLRDGVCNAISGDQFETAPGTVRKHGYFNNYEQGEKLFSKEPLTLVTREDDGAWSDFVNWIIEALLGAEEQSISQNRANLFIKTTKFGTQYENMFVNAIRQVGNYGEMYERNFQFVVPRKDVNTINDGTSTGLIYAMPFGNTALKGPDPIEGSTLRRIKERGFLRCGVTTRAIFSTFDPTTESYNGFDIDMCRAVSAAIFSGVTNTIEYTNLLATDRFQFLENDVVDLLSRVTTHTFERDVFEANAKVGFSFSQPYFYDGVGFGGIPPYGQCADRQDTTSEQCQNLMICVNDGTTSIERVRQLFPERYILPKESGDAAAQGLALGDCNAIGGGVFDVAVSNIREVGQYDGPYEQGTNRYSKDPLALVTRQDDPQWSDFVYWVLSGIFYAEEGGITQESAFRMPIVNLFGTSYNRMLQNAVAAVGSYAEIYDRHVEADFARSGLNLLNEQPLGAQHYPLPGIEV